MTRFTVLIGLVCILGGLETQQFWVALIGIICIMTAIP